MRQLGKSGAGGKRDGWKKDVGQGQKAKVKGKC